MEIEKQYCITDTSERYNKNYLIYLKDKEFKHLSSLTLSITPYLIISRSDYSQKDIDTINSFIIEKLNVFGRDVKAVAFYNIPFDIMSLDSMDSVREKFYGAYGLDEMSHKELNEELNRKLNHKLINNISCK